MWKESERANVRWRRARGTASLRGTARGGDVRARERGTARSGDGGGGGARARSGGRSKFERLQRSNKTFPRMLQHAKEAPPEEALDQYTES
eukprot:SAG11_NODE_3181_length_2626_cov_2.488326_3_plen_91_part_00